METVNNKHKQTNSGVVDNDSRERGKVAIFLQTAEKFRQRSKNTCKFLTKEIMSAPKLNFELKLLPKWPVFSPKICVCGKKLGQI